MIVKGITEEDFSNCRKPSMVIGFPNCSFKCDKECGFQVCQNGALANSQNININIEDICNRYLDNNITHSIVCGGLEPFDSWEDLVQLISHFRSKTFDNIIIYTGYYKEEIGDKITLLSHFENIIVKFGRFIPYQNKHYDKTLGVELASYNQYAEIISK